MGSYLGAPAEEENDGDDNQEQGTLAKWRKFRTAHAFRFMLLKCALFTFDLGTDIAYASGFESLPLPFTPTDCVEPIFSFGIDCEGYNYLFGYFSKATIGDMTNAHALRYWNGIDWSGFWYYCFDGDWLGGQCETTPDAGRAGLPDGYEEEFTPEKLGWWSNYAKFTLWFFISKECFKALLFGAFFVVPQRILPTHNPTFFKYIMVSPLTIGLHCVPSVRQLTEETAIMISTGREPPWSYLLDLTEDALGMVLPIWYLRFGGAASFAEVLNLFFAIAMLLVTGMGLLLDLKDPVKRMGASFIATLESNAAAPVRQEATLPSPGGPEVRLPGGGDEHQPQQQEERLLLLLLQQKLDAQQRQIEALVADNADMKARLEARLERAEAALASQSRGEWAHGSNAA